MLQAELKILGGKHQGKAIPLTTKKFLVGREQDCQLRPNSDLVSRHHCVFSIDDFTIRLRDLGSTNGTRVNGKPLHGEVILKAGDKIGIGKLELELVLRQRADAPADSASDLPVAEPPGLAAGLSSGELEIASSMGTVEIAPLSAEMPLSSDTSFELPTSFAPLASDTATNLAADTTILPGAVPNPYPGYAPLPPAGYPGMSPGYPGAPGYPGPQGYPGYPMQPMGQPMGGYPQQVAYPGQYPPGYAPPGYPAMPGYPMQGQYPAGYPGGAVQAPAAPEPAAADPAALAVRLPPPESTGAKSPAAPAAAVPGAPKVAEEKPSNSAADIIKSYMQKRTR